jgi:hypothetical protein
LQGQAASAPRTVLPLWGSVDEQPWMARRSHRHRWPRGVRQGHPLRPRPHPPMESSRRPRQMILVVAGCHLLCCVRRGRRAHPRSTQEQSTVGDQHRERRGLLAQHPSPGELWLCCGVLTLTFAHNIFSFTACVDGWMVNGPCPCPLPPSTRRFHGGFGPTITRLAAQPARVNATFASPRVARCVLAMARCGVVGVAR